jgi:hypothetical protein
VDKDLNNVKTKGELVISSISVSDKASGLRKGDVKVLFGHDLEVNLAEELLTINNMKFGLQDILIEMIGSVKNFKTTPPSVDLKISSNQIKMASVLKEVPASLSPEIPKLSAKGYAELKATVVGVVDTAAPPKVNATVTLNQMAFGHKDLPAGINDLNGEILATENSLEIKNFGFKLDQHPVSVAMLVTDLLDVPDLKNLAVDCKLELEPLMKLADKFVGLPEGFALSGLIESKIRAQGKLNPENPMGIKAEGNVDLKNISLESKELPDKLLVNGALSINNDKMDEKLKVQIGESDVSVNVKVQNYLAMAMPELAKGKTTKVKVDVVSGMLDLDKILPTPSGEEEKKEEEETEPLTAYPSLPPVEVDMTVRLNKTKLLDLEMTNYNQITSIRNNVVTSSLVGSLYTGSFSNKLSVDLNDTTDAKIDMNLDVTRVEANDFISRLNDKLPAKNEISESLAQTDNTVYGKFTMNMDVTTHGLPQDFANNLVGRIKVKIHDGKLVDVKMVDRLNNGIDQIQDKVKIAKKISLGDLSFSKFEATLEARDGKLLVKHCDVSKSPVGSLDLTGAIGFDTKLDLTLENHMSSTLSRPILGAQKKLQGAASGAASKLGGAAGTAAGAVAGSFAAVPEDKQGRAIAYYTMKGTVTDPKIGVDFKRMASEASGGAKQAAKDLLDKKKEELKAKAKAELDKQKANVLKKKKELEDAGKAKLDAEKAKLEAKKKAAEEKKKAAEAEAAKKKEEAKKKTKDEAKKKLKKIGF